MIIETDRMVLRPITTADADQLVRLDSDPTVMRYVSGGTPTPADTIAEWVIPRAIDEMARRPGVGIWAAVDVRMGFAGWFSLRAPRHSRGPELELTYRLRRNLWGCGLGTEGSRAMMTLAFGELGTLRVFAGTMAANTASRRVMEKSGMHLAGLHHAADGDRRDRDERGEVEYELLRSEWETARFPWARSARPISHLIA
ncbi:GNAT family N-acetyltransferase [Williamsia sterculiae]|uniref:Protein N-acetyltransferase, RimJ/RimL family n=1 Tax=Williamsia sterculiae TaxID=1344003 RepID=A0A1N7H2P6_9NOCA|nr:GNAT family N-acetyltransferase [Williamsia sterculiae]SIS19030.1 Protein N-acetyltransferase, RimJ/RimL family [Williamsia sterculiae]